MTERDRWDLRGPVHICRIERTWYSRRCGTEVCETEERSDVTTVEFREDGSLAQRRHENPDGSKHTTRHKYDDSGRLTIVQAESADGLISLRLHDYDSNGRLARVIARSQNGDDRIAESYEYDATGRKTKTLYIDLASRRSDTIYSYAVDGTDSTYSGPGAATVTTLHNEREQPTVVLFRDGAGRTITRIEFSYDPEGNMIEEVQTNIPEMLIPEKLSELNQSQIETLHSLFGTVRRIHLYDEQGRRVETRSRIGPLGEDRKTVSYNENGDPVEEVFEHQEREYGIDQEGKLSEAPTREHTIRSEARLQYEYDAHGNWVLKTVESRSGSGEDFRRCSVERRAISYFA